MKKNTRLILLNAGMQRNRPWVAALFLSLVFSTVGESQSTSFTYEGRLYSTSGVPLLESVDVKFQILNPAGNCVLYEEVQSGVDLSSSKGAFSLSVGSAVGDSKRSANFRGAFNPSMISVFRNGATLSGIPTADCAAGTYVAGASDNRLLRVQVTKGSTTETLSPDLVINTVPSAQVANSLQGFLPSDFLRLDVNNGISGNLGLTATGTGAGQTREFRFYELAANGVEYSAFKAPDAMATSLTYVLPSSAPAAGDVLKATVPSSGVVTLSWGADAGAGGGISNFNGSNQSSQSFTAVDIAAVVTAPAWSTNTGTGAHTLQIPMAIGAGVTGGLITKAEHTAFSSKVDRAGDTMSGNLAMGTNKITGVGDPTNAQEAATKAYVDSQDSGKLSGTLTATRIPFASGASTLSDDAALVWDNTNKRLGVGTASPGRALDVNGSLNLKGGVIDLSSGSTSGVGLSVGASSSLVFNANGSNPRAAILDSSINARGDGTLGFAPSSNPVVTPDSSFSRLAAGVIGVGTGAAGNSGGTLVAGNVGIGNPTPGAMLQIGTAGTSLGTMRLTGNTSGFVQVQPAAAAGSWNLTLPPDDGNTGDMLRTDGNGVTTWVAASGGISGLTTGRIPFATSATTVGDDSSLFWDNTNKRLGVGTTSPGYKLDLGTGNDDAFRIRNSAAGGNTNNGIALVSGGSTSYLDFAGANLIIKNNTYAGLGGWNGGANIAMTILSGGNVGIGTTSPTRTLHIDAGTTAGNIGVQIDGAPGTAITSSTSLGLNNTSAGSFKNQIRLQGGGSTKWTFGNDANANGSQNFFIYDSVAAQTRFFIDGSGNVGIGTTSPTNPLSVSRADGIWEVARLTNSATASLLQFVDNGSNSTEIGGMGGSLVLRTSGQERLTISNSGNVGIGTTSPVSRLHVGADPTANANYGLLSLGSGPFNGSTAGFFAGSSSGTLLAGNAASGYTGDLLNLQIAGAQKMLLTQEGVLSTSGQIVSGSFNNGGATSVDWNKGNVQITSSAPGAITFSNMLDGGTYILVCTSTTSGTFTFSHPTLAFEFAPDNGPTIASTRTTYTFVRAGNTVYTSWITGYD